MNEAGAAKGRVRHPHPGWWVSVLTGMTLLGILAFHDGASTWWHQHVTSLFTPGLLRGIFWVAVALHVAEGLWAGWSARRHGGVGHPLGWLFQTLLLGWPSTRLLRREIAAGRPAHD